jgi:diguanylate cyclase (GGDEF)-like protein
MKLTNRAINYGRRGLPLETHRAAWIGFVALLLLSIVALDSLTGELPVHHFYYLPIVLAAVRFKKKGGLAAACAAGALYHLTNPNTFHQQNLRRDLVQLGVFIGMGWIAAKLAEDAERMRNLAHTDDLTGLHNLRSFELNYAALLRQARDCRTPLALLVLDLDHLKSINERYSHIAGAQAIQTMGRVIAEHVPGGAIACRYGGDEFVILLPEYSLLRAAHVAKCLQTNLLRLSPVLAGNSLPPGSLTISAGVASLSPRPDEDLLSAGERLFREADDALFQAKAQGRNRVCYA